MKVRDTLHKKIIKSKISKKFEGKYSPFKKFHNKIIGRTL